MKPLGGALVGYAQQRISEGLRDWLQASFERVFVVADRASLLDGAQKLQPALILADATLAEGDIRALVEALRRDSPASRILLISASDLASGDLAALAAGRGGVVRTDALVHDLSAAIDAMIAGRDFAVPAAAAQPQSGPAVASCDS
jgi:DNA-binding NarL/FixJ family response regulator